MKILNWFRKIFKGKEIKKEDNKIFPDAHIENQNENSTNKEILVVPIISTEEKLDKGLILKFLPILFSFFGASVIYSYLNSIDRLNLFPEIIFSTNFIYIAIVSILLSFLISLALAMPYLYAIAFKDIYGKLYTTEEIKTLSSKTAITSFISVFALYFIALTLNYLYIKYAKHPLLVEILDYFDIDYAKYFSLALIFFSIFIPMLCLIYTFKKIDRNFTYFNPNIINGCFTILLIQCVYFSFSAYFIYINILFNEEKYYIIIAITALWIFFNFINIFFVKEIFHNKSFNKDALSLLSISFFAMFFVFYISSDTINQRLLYPLRFIEKPSDSSWYLLQNNPYTDKSEFIINGIKYTDLKEIKGIFTKECKENDLSCHRANSRSNALYGYMAWNLGETKVFCPKPKSVEEEKDYSKCLTINGSLLQPLDEQYIQ